MNDVEAIPIEKGVARREGELSFRYNPETGVGALSVGAYRALGEPERVGVWLMPHSEIVIIGPTDNEYIGRKVSKKRTFSITRLRDYLGVSNVTRWALDRWEDESLFFDENTKEQ